MQITNLFYLLFLDLILSFPQSTAQDSPIVNYRIKNKIFNFIDYS